MTQTRAVCRVCLRESVNFDELIGNSIAHPDITAQFYKSFVFSEDSDFCAHAACLCIRQTATNILKKEVCTRDEPSALEVFVLDDYKLEDAPDAPDRCLVCRQDGFLNAKVHTAPHPAGPR